MEYSPTVPNSVDTSVSKSRNYILWTLFKSMFMLSACTFGGGFVIVSLMKKKYVEELGWLSEDEMLDITAITQSSPGPLPVNASVIIGYRMCGILGSAIALQVMRAGVAAVIFDVVINLCKNVIKTKRILYIAMMCIAFVATYYFGISAMLIILICLGIGIADLLI